MRSLLPSILLLCCLSYPAICLSLDITDCGSKSGKFTSVIFTGCDMNKPVCELVRNTNVSLEIDFVLNKDVSKVTAVVHGIIMDIPVPFPLSSANACEDSLSGLTCPLSKDGSYQFKHLLPVLKTYPKLSLTVKWELRDENNEDIVCILIPARIK